MSNSMGLVEKQAVIFISFVIEWTTGCNPRTQAFFAVSGELHGSTRLCTQVSYWPKVLRDCEGGCAGSIRTSVGFGVPTGQSVRDQILSPVCKESEARCCHVLSDSQVRLHILHLCVDREFIGTVGSLNFLKYKYVIFYFNNPIKAPRQDTNGEYSLLIANTILSHYNLQRTVVTTEVVEVVRPVATFCTCSPCFDSDNPLTSQVCNKIIQYGGIQTS